MKAHLIRVSTMAKAFVVVLLGAASVAHAVKTTGGEYNSLHAGPGAKGYDAGAYFTDGRPTPGTDRYTYDYGGVKWQFASKEHRDAFAANPAKYTPQYGGFCSWGVSVGKLFDVDPVNGWKIVDGKLYLNFNAEINDTFAKDARSFIAKADRNWPALNR
jgi:YHS domain-containing protein